MSSVASYTFTTKVGDLGLLVRLERITRRLHQAELAVLGGVRSQDVSNLERGVYVHPLARRRILAVLDIQDDRGVG